ncbi:MAG: RloB family protein [Candidatus Symbiothrix sp.]|jgi:Skp family chaperone for outer membrane proteins|nr:RloB family protein [Candidatus Symbiothrix sp.]
MRTSKQLRQKKTVFSFVVDGECEVWYLQLLKQEEKLLNINVEPKLPQKKKLKDQFAMVLELAQESDKVFWIIDFDTIYRESREAGQEKKTALQELQGYYGNISQNTESVIVIIVNNPCLEYWFLLHFEATSKYYESYAKLERALKKHKALADYEKSEKYYKTGRQNIYQRLKPYLQTAIKDAKRLGKFDFNNTQTGMAEIYKLFDELNKEK